MPADVGTLVLGVQVECAGLGRLGGLVCFGLGLDLPRRGGRVGTRAVSGAILQKIGSVLSVSSLKQLLQSGGQLSNTYKLRSSTESISMTVGSCSRRDLRLRAFRFRGVNFLGVRVYGVWGVSSWFVGSLKVLVYLIHFIMYKYRNDLWETIF